MVVCCDLSLSKRLTVMYSVLSVGQIVTAVWMAETAGNVIACYSHSNTPIHPSLCG